MKPEESLTEWDGVSRFYIAPTWSDTGGECPIYSNGLNKIRVMVYILPIDKNRQPIPHSELEDDEIRKRIKLIDFSNGSELTRESEGNAAVVDGWYYSDSPNEFDAIPERFGVRRMVAEQPAGVEGLRFFDFYVYALQPAGGKTIQVAIQVETTSGKVISTSRLNQSMASQVSFRSKKPIVYHASDCQYKSSNWEKAESFRVGYVQHEPDLDYACKRIYVRPTAADKAFVKSKFIGTGKTDGELTSLKRQYFDNDLDWLARYYINRTYTFAYYAYNINPGDAGDVYKDGDKSYRLLGRKNWAFYVKIPIPIGADDARRAGSFQILITRQKDAGRFGSAKLRSFDPKFAIYDQYGNICKVEIDMLDEPWSVDEGPGTDVFSDV
ncbi:hypothetical protein B0G81_7805 [Paraburkholderia sp. BL6665CI2N2]|uniref:hypothetical protein n=1 Tax=Paraburkholderia sp. BL6665CI2N2 TaxID=1938806 RepID=UPI001065FA7E|nr:hypothetical protein [Paraburkholderia sp. BL6665CI2N2]TDY16716.1 hypothetical protein B0G81_7805 [Paraburkholderia sp. BL6665CI2N2]